MNLIDAIHDPSKFPSGRPTVRGSVRTAGALCALLLIAVAGGCNSSPPSAAQSAPAAPLPTVPLAAELRVLQPGDNWEYEGTVEVRFHETGKTVALKTARTVSVVQAKLDGKPFLALVTADEGTAPNGYREVLSWSHYFTQDPKTRDVIGHADTRGKDNSVRTVAVPSLDLPGTWQATTTFTFEDLFSNGDKDNKSVAVTGTEEVETPFARVACWKATVQGTTVERGEPRTSRSTVWVAPQLGQPVKIQSTVSFPNRTLTGTSVLKSTNVSCEQRK